MFLKVDYTSRIAAIRSVGVALGAPGSIMPDPNAAMSGFTALQWLNQLRVFKSLPPLPGLDYNGFITEINRLAALVGAPPPANTVAPVASGSLTVGSTLSVTNGTWTNSPTGYTYQWQRNGANISGATGATYVTVTADGGTNVSCLVTATNAGGSASQASNALAIAAAGAAFLQIAATSVAGLGPTLAINTTGADLLVVHLASDGVQAVSIADSYGNTWLTAIDNAATFGSTIFYCQPPVSRVGAGHTFTITTARTFPAVSVAAFAGSAPSALDQTGSGASGAASLTPSVANTLVVTGLNSNGAAIATPAAFSWLTNIGKGADFGSYLAFQTQAAPAAVTATWTGTAPTGTTIVSFKLAQAPSSQWSWEDSTLTASTLSNGNLTLVTTGAALWRTLRNTVAHSSGKWYIEFSFAAVGSTPGWELLGLCNSILTNPSQNLGAIVNSAGVGHQGTFVSAGFTSNGTITTLVIAADVWALAVDFGAGSMWIAHNNIWSNSGNPATGANPIVSFVPATVGPLFAAASFNYAGDNVTLQALAASQAYAPPSGFTAWG